MWYWQIDREIETQWEERDVPETDLPKYAQVAYFWQRWQKCRIIQWRNDSFSTSGIGAIEYLWGK